MLVEGLRSHAVSNPTCQTSSQIYKRCSVHCISMHGKRTYSQYNSGSRNHYLTKRNQLIFFCSRKTSFNLQEIIIWQNHPQHTSNLSHTFFLSLLNLSPTCFCPASPTPQSLLHVSIMHASKPSKPCFFLPSSFLSQLLTIPSSIY